MGVCYIELAQLDAAEESFLQALSMYSALFPGGDYRISNSEPISIEITAVVNDQHLLLFLQLKVN